MILHIGIKSDPVEYRYSYDWLFSLMEDEGVGQLQLGSSFEFYFAADGYFDMLLERADRHGVRIKSCFTAHRELGGVFTGNSYLEEVAERAYTRHVEIAGMLGADFVGGNPGAVYRDQMQKKAQGVAKYLELMKKMMAVAWQKGLKGVTVEPMSSSAEPPTTPGEIIYFMNELSGHHERHPETTVPAYLCGDVSHGFANEDRVVVHDNLDLFELGIPYMIEFHFKNTDSHFESTFGFSPHERARGIVDLHELKARIDRNEEHWPAEEITGYLEIGGPKLGRDYSDRELRRQLAESIAALRAIFDSGC